MTRALTLLRTARALGIPSIARVLLYRFGLRLGMHPVCHLRGVAPRGPFWQAPSAGAPAAPSVSWWKTRGLLFGYREIPVTATPPDWLTNPLSGVRFPDVARAWWEIPDFDPRVGDIKLIWELSRMDWLLALAQQARQGDSAALARMNDWLSDWCRCNPPYEGPNWKCGQEASIRVMHLAMATLLLGQVDATGGALRELVRLHLQRIAPTMSYAIGQDNNHGTSEAAALFIGGSWLERLGVREGARWARQGRRWLAERAQRLIAADGSFSQYSLNYHRVMLDTYSMAEVWRRHLGLPTFAQATLARLRAAQGWLYAMVDPTSGDGPNVGANDGAQLLRLADLPYRDFRPSVQLAGALFCGERAYAEHGSWDHPLLWLGLDPALPLAVRPASRQADDGGFAVLRRGPAMAMMRYPRFHFRPAQSDALHVDFWLGGENLLRDAGTYSYNTATQWLEYFGGPAGHNTVQFDDRAQMPRLGRFLLGDWLQTSRVEHLREEHACMRFGAAYRDRWGASHFRRVVLEERRLEVVDEIEEFANKAVLRWRLAPRAWILEGSVLRAGPLRLVVQSDVPIVRCQLVEGWESRHYLEKTALPVLEVEIAQAGTLVTELTWPI
jgi:hypothetical protein